MSKHYSRHENLKKMETSRRLSVLPARWEYIILHLKHMLNVIFQEMLEKEAVLMFFSHFIFYSFRKIQNIANLHSICGPLVKFYRKHLQLCLIHVVTRNLEWLSLGSSSFWIVLFASNFLSSSHQMFVIF